MCRDSVSCDRLLVTSFLLLGREFSGVMVLVLEMFNRLSNLDLLDLSRVLTGVLDRKVPLVGSSKLTLCLLLTEIDGAWFFEQPVTQIQEIYFSNNLLKSYPFEGKEHSFHFFQYTNNISHGHRSPPSAFC